MLTNVSHTAEQAESEPRYIQIYFRIRHTQDEVRSLEKIEMVVYQYRCPLDWEIYSREK